MAMPLRTGLCACALHYPTRATQREPPEVKRRIFFISSGIMSTDPPIETDPPAADPPAADPNSDIRAMIKSSLLEVLRENPTLLRPPVQQPPPGGDPPQDGEGSKSPRHHMAGSLAQPGGDRAFRPAAHRSLLQFSLAGGCGMPEQRTVWGWFPTPRVVSQLFQ